MKLLLTLLYTRSIASSPPPRGVVPVHGAVQVPGPHPGEEVATRVLPIDRRRGSGEIWICEAEVDTFAEPAVDPLEAPAQSPRGVCVKAGKEVQVKPLVEKHHRHKKATDEDETEVKDIMGYVLYGLLFRRLFIHDASERARRMFGQ